VSRKLNLINVNLKAVSPSVCKWALDQLFFLPIKAFEIALQTAMIGKKAPDNLKPVADFWTCTLHHRSPPQILLIQWSAATIELATKDKY